MKCDDYDCVDSADFSFLHTAWLKYCDDETIIVSDADENGVDDACDGVMASFEGLPPLPTDEVLRSFGLEVPPSDWKGYRRGVLLEWQRLEARRAVIKERRQRNTPERSIR